MITFLKSARKSRKRNSRFHGFSWQQRKQYKRNIDKNVFERPSDAYVSIVKISFQLNLSFRSYVGEEGFSLNSPWVKVWVKNILGGRGLKVTKFQLLTPKHFSIVVKNVYGGPSCPHHVK